MKRNRLVWLVGLICMFPLVVNAGNKLPWEKKLPFESATIKYAIHGMEEGEEILYIRDYGKETATYHTTVTKMMGMAINNTTIEFTTPDFIYTYDLQEKSGFKSVNPKKIMIEEYEKLSSAEKKTVQKNAEQMGVSFAEGMGGEIEQNAVEIQGFSCDKVNIINGATIYLIHGTEIPLKTEMEMMGMKMNMEATSITKGKVDSMFFQHPAGIVAEINSESDAMSRTIARETIAMLKDPAGARKTPALPMGVPSGQQNGMSEEDKQMMEQMMQGIKGMLKQ